MGDVSSKDNREDTLDNKDQWFDRGVTSLSGRIETIPQQKQRSTLCLLPDRSADPSSLHGGFNNHSHLASCAINKTNDINGLHYDATEDK